MIQNLTGNFGKKERHFTEQATLANTNTYHAAMS